MTTRDEARERLARVPARHEITAAIMTAVEISQPQIHIMESEAEVFSDAILALLSPEGDGSDRPRPSVSEDICDAPSLRESPAPWEPGRCQVPMWTMGAPSGFCGDPTHGPQLPARVLLLQRGWSERDVPYCHGPCCPKHGGPNAGDPILFVDGYGNGGRLMWCAVMPGFINLQESPAGFSEDPMAALDALLVSYRKDGASPKTTDKGGE